MNGIDINTIGILVENEDKDILYYNDNFIIEVDVCNKDIRSTIEDKLEKVLHGKAFRIERISKKISKILSSTNLSNTKDIIMYLVEVYMYSDNSDFIKIENIINNINNPLYEDCLLQYIRYDKYTGVWK